MRPHLLALLTVAFAACCPAHGQSLDEARAYLTKWEGCTLMSVTRPNGEIVVGVGHKVDSPIVSPLSKVQVELLFRVDYRWAMIACRAGVEDFDSLPLQARLVALGVAFNVGPTGFTRFTAFCTDLSYRMYDLAAHELAESKRSQQIGEARAIAEYHLLADLH